MTRLKKLASKPSFKQFREDNDQLYNEIAFENGWHADDDFEKIEMKMYEDEYIPKYGEDPEF